MPALETTAACTELCKRPDGANNFNTCTYALGSWIEPPVTDAKDEYFSDGIIRSSKGDNAESS
jgi:hypothetical protein